MRALISHYIESFKGLQPNVWILSIAMFINRSGSMVLLFTSLYLTTDLNYSISEAGFIMSFYGFGSILGSYLGGWLTDRKNHREIMLFALISSSLVLLLMLLATSKWFIIVIIFSYALTADMFRPANSAAVASFSDAGNRTRSVSLMRLAINLGFSVGPALGGFAAYHFGYKWLFVIDSFSGIAAALMLAIYLPKQPKAENKHKSKVLMDSRTSAYRDWSYLTFIVLVAIYGMCFFQIFASIPQYFNRECNFTEDEIGLLLALNGLLVVLIEMPLVAALQKTKNMFIYIIAGTLCLPLSFLILMFGNCLIFMAIVYTFVITMSEIFAMPFMMNITLSRPLPERQGQYAALYSIAYGLSIIAAPSVGLGLADAYGFDFMLLFFISVSTLLALGFALQSRRFKSEKQKRKAVVD